MLLLACFAVFIQFPSTAFASVPAQNSAPPCQAEIQRIEAAKGDLKQEMQRPADGWVKLEKLPDQWEKHWPDFHGMAWYKIHFSYGCADNLQNLPVSFAIEGITQSGRVFLNDDLLWQDLSVKAASQLAADLTGIKKKVAYQRALELTQQDQ